VIKMSVYHSFKPVKLFEKEIESNEFFKCKEKEWVAVIPAMKYRIWITLESDYPREVFGAPKYYALYCDWDGVNQCFGSGTREQLKEAILRFKANKCFWNNLGRHAYRVFLEWNESMEKIYRY